MPIPIVRTLVRTALASVATATIAAALAVPANAHGDSSHDDARATKARSEYLAGTSLPLLMSPNVSWVGNTPDVAGISGCFARTAPFFYLSSTKSISVYDTSDPVHPRLTGLVDNVVFENEAMNCGERKQGQTTERFVLVGNDLVDASSSDIDHTSDSVGGSELVIVDVTDPTKPFVRSRTQATTGTHTVACVVDTDCRYVYSSGDGRGDAGRFSVFDLADLDEPVELDSDPATAGTQPFRSPAAGHKWNFDNAGFGTHTGWSGSAIFDVSDPAHPAVVTTTGTAGDSRGGGAVSGYNNFIHHNSFRPNASAFRADAPPSIANGNVLLVTEEDYEQVDCTQAGSFQTWWVKHLDGRPGAIVPLDKVELADLGSFPSPVGAFCSAHWFDYHPSGIVSAGFYGGGMQLLDVRDPHDIKPFGHAMWVGSEVWDAYWVPVYNKNGTATGKRTNVVYTVDLVRGLDVYTVALPGSATTASPLAVAGAVPADGFLSWPGGAMAGALTFAGLAGLVLTLRRADRLQGEGRDSAKA